MSKTKINGYNLTRAWYNYKFKHPSKVKAKHSDMYFYIIDLWNRLGNKEEFGLPTSVTMEALQIGSYNTFKNVLNDIIDFGFVKLITASVNQHQSKVIALSYFDKATDEALDNAHNRAHDKPLDSIDKPRNTETNNNNHTVYYFDVHYLKEELLITKLKANLKITDEQFKEHYEEFIITNYLEPLNAEEYIKAKAHFLNWTKKKIKSKPLEETPEEREARKQEEFKKSGLG